MGVSAGIASTFVAGEQYHEGKKARRKAEKQADKDRKAIEKEKKEAARLKAIEDEKSSTAAEAAAAQSNPDLVGSRISAERAVIARRGGSYAKSKGSGGIG